MPVSLLAAALCADRQSVMLAYGSHLQPVIEKAVRAWLLLHCTPLYPELQVRNSDSIQLSRVVRGLEWENVQITMELQHYLWPKQGIVGIWDWGKLLLATHCWVRC